VDQGVNASLRELVQCGGAEKLRRIAVINGRKTWRILPTNGPLRWEALKKRTETQTGSKHSSEERRKQFNTTRNDR